jgi:hypothetical protein
MNEYITEKAAEGGAFYMSLLRIESVNIDVVFPKLSVHATNDRRVRFSGCPKITDTQLDFQVALVMFQASGAMNHHAVPCFMYHAHRPPRLFLRLTLKQFPKFSTLANVFI